MRMMSVLDLVQFQNPLSPELVAEIRQLDALQFLMLIIFVGLVGAIAIMWRRQRTADRQADAAEKQADANSKLADRLAVNTDVLQDQSKHLEAMVAISQRTMTLIEAGSADAKATREGVAAVAKLLTDSGILHLKDAINQQTDLAVGNVITELALVQRTVEAVVQELNIRDTRDEDRVDRLVNQLTGFGQSIDTMKNLLEMWVKPPDIVPPTAPEAPAEQKASEDQ